MSFGNRKAYLGLKASMVEFFRSPTRYLAESNQMESQFEKPYLGDDYRKIQLNLPTPDWPSWSFDGAINWKKPETHSASGPCPGCALYADPLFEDDCSDPVEIHAGIYCTNTPGAPTAQVKTKNAAVFNRSGEITAPYKQFVGKEEWIVDKVSSGIQAGDTSLDVFAEEGEIINVTVGAWGFLGPSAAVYVNPQIEKHRICGTMVDGGGNTCTTCVDVRCVLCDCATVTPITVNAGASDDTISDAVPATVTVQDGCGPYTWSVSGTGFSIDPAGPSDLAIAVVSASGGCGTATVTVTDKCGTSVTHKILHTTGTWASQGNVCGMSAPFDTRTWTGSAYDLVKVDGDQKQLQTVEYTNYYDLTPCAGDCAGVDFSSSAWCDFYGYEAQGICIWTFQWCECNITVDPERCDSYRTSSIEHFHWECA